MENTFYKHVSSWISGYHNPDGLHYLRKFVNNSQETLEVKEQLHREIDHKYATLHGLPCFADFKGESFLIDGTGHPRIYTTRFAAICKVAELKLKGFAVELVPGEVFYRIKEKPMLDPDGDPNRMWIGGGGIEEAYKH